MKKFISFLMSVILVVASAFGVSAVDVDRSTAIPSQEAVVVTTPEDTGIETQSLGTLLASNIGTIYTQGTIQVTLPQGNFSADFVAQIGYSPVSTVVTCWVTTPDGNYLDLGSMSGNGSTRSYTLFYAQSGTYTFHFNTGTSQGVQLRCSIYD